MKILITGGSGFIGISLLDYYCGKNGIDLLNADVQKPRKDEHMSYWKQCDVLDLVALEEIFEEFRPTHVVHLAARTDTEGYKLEHYKTNTDGTANVLTAIKKTSSVSRFIFTSTQFVCRPGKMPAHDEDFNPHTVYGQSKVVAEQLIRSANLNCIWTIVRPTNIWGPWHRRYPYEFWRILAKGLYFHPSGRSPVRCYGYVRNAVFQIDKILRMPSETVNHCVYYLGDPPISLLDWVNGFSLALTGRKARIVPRGVLLVLGLTGDMLSILGFKPPLRLSRFRSMTQDYLTPMESTIKTFGQSPVSLEEGIKETVGWLQQMGLVKKIYLA